MEYELEPITEPGRRFTALAEEHAADFSTRADQHDRDASFPFENVAALQKSGFMAAPVPAEFGGMGLQSAHDLMVGMSRLARGCASTAIASNMHITGAMAITRLWRRARDTGDALRGDATEGLLKAVGAGSVVLCFPTTEPGTDLTAPFTEATRVDGGFSINGMKIFGTLSPAAAIFFPTVRIPNASGGYDIATAVVPRGTNGMTVLDDWDALGMRASGSNSVAFKDCLIPESALFRIEGQQWSVLNASAVEVALGGNLSLATTFLGMAEAARDIAVKTATAARKGPRGKRLAERIPIQQIVAEMDIDLAVCRAIADRTGRIADAYMARGIGVASSEEANAVFKEFQCMKWVVNRKAIDVVDRAMVVAGGAAYMSKSPLSRLYRDVRAGPFMQPFARYEALEYIGKVALGVAPVLDR